MVAIGVGVLIGAFAGLYFQVVILVPLTILALLGTATVDAANGLSLRIALFHIACTWVSLQFAYLGSSILVSRSQREFRPIEREKVSNNLHPGDQNEIQERELSQAHETMEAV